MAHVASLHANSDIGFSREYDEILRSVQSICQIRRFNQSGLLADFVAHVASLHANSDIGFSREYNEILRSVKSISQASTSMRSVQSISRLVLQSIRSITRLCGPHSQSPCRQQYWLQSRVQRDPQVSAINQSG